MSDDKSNRGPADRSRINVNEPYEVDYWTNKYSCTKDELKAAVKAVGVMAADVEKYLKR